MGRKRIGPKVRFIDYLKQTLKQETFRSLPERDFAEDAAQDRKFRDFSSWDDLRGYIYFTIGGCTEAYEPAKALLQRWANCQNVDIDMTDDTVDTDEFTDADFA